MQKDEQALLFPTLERLTVCLPRHELLEIVKDAEEVEALLKIEIGRLHEKLNNAQPLSTAKEVTDKAMSVNEMLTSFETPADKFGATVSALIGRLRKPLETPHPPHSTLIHHIAQRDKLLQKPGKTEDLDSQKKKQSEQVQALLDLQKNPIFTNKMTEATALLSLWKRISGHRSANVFRRAVSERDAPGYTDKILFPVDLSLIRKMVTAGIIDSYAEFQKYIGLMSHNCVKFNGRESDYGIVAREFESYVDESIVTAVNAATEAAIKKGEVEAKKSLQKKEQPASSLSVSEKKKTEAPATKPKSTPPSSVSGPATAPAVAPSAVDPKQSNSDLTPASAPMTSILSTIPKKKTGNAISADVSSSKTKDADTKSQFQAPPLPANAGDDVSAKTTNDDSTMKGEVADHAVSEAKSVESTNVSATETTKGSGGNISDTSKSASEQNDTGRSTPRVSPKRKRSKPSEDEATSNASTSTSTRRSKRGRQST